VSQILSNCHGCADYGMSARHEVLFTDSRTGYAYCHGCIVALVSWELDGEPEPEELPFPEWIAP
jgi:hypothetical protein